MRRAPHRANAKRTVSVFNFELPPAATRGRGLPGRGPRLHSHGDGGPAVGPAGPLLGRLRSRVQPPARRARLDRPDLAQAVRRTGALVPRALRAARGAAGRRRAGRRALGGRAPERTAAAALRHRGPARALPAADRARRAFLRHRHERAGLRLGPGLDPHAGGAPGRRVRRQRHQGVDQQRAPQPVRDRALPHRGRARQEARGALAVSRRSQIARDHRSGRSSTWPARTTSTRSSSRMPSCQRTCGWAATAMAGSR